MSGVLQPDLCIIGAGPAGSAVAKAAAAVGARVVLIEKGAMAGEAGLGDAATTAALISAARLAHETRNSAVFGLRGIGAPEVDFKALRHHMRSASEALAPNEAAARFAALNVRVIRAAARFVSKDRVEAGGCGIRPRRFIVATGSCVDIGAAPGLDQAPHVTARTLPNLNELPEKLLVLGGGPISLALAQAFGRLGSEIVVVAPGRALDCVDPEFAAVALTALRREGVHIRENVDVVAVESSGRGIAMRLRGAAGEEAVEASHLLIAEARRPDVEGLSLGAAGVAFNAQGVAIDRNFRTANPRIFALGDVVGEPWAGRSADYQASLVVRAALLRWPAGGRADLAPRVVSTDPEIAYVGLSEEQARQGGRPVRVWRWPFADSARAQGECATRGHVKIIASARGRVLGAGLVAPGASELIAPWQMAVAKRIRVSDMAGLVCPSSSRSEASRRAALASLMPQLRGPWLGRALRVARWLG